jgi:hypothetical protein
MKNIDFQSDNPFLVSGYYSSKYFCDREKETERILEAMQNNRNLALLSLRRMGKTALIEHAFHSNKIKAEFDCFYIDIYASANVENID